MKLDKVMAVREAGYVKRLHTTPHLREYTVAEHSWNMATLLFLLHPDPTLELVRSCLFHDVAERWTGDMPAPMKWWISPDAGQALAVAEAKILMSLDLANRLSPEDTAWLHALDVLELMLYCEDEINLGNRHIQEVRSICGELLYDEKKTPKEIIEWLRSSRPVIRTSDKEFKHVED